MRIPSATYRLQFNSGFRFSDAIRIVDYLSGLGITHVYASPLMKARRGSNHGYDVTDPNQINPEIGTQAEFEEFSHLLHQREMGLILDIVPNHMSASLENPWWVDILTNGEASSYAGFLDIDWTAHKVLLPILAKPYGECLESGEISIRQVNGRTTLEVARLELPIQVSSGERIQTVDDLDRVISAQPYRLAYWRKAGDAINYRRFFDINDLVGVRAERDDVFQATHATTLKLIKDGLVDGLRIDHIDGLANPKAYLERLPETYVVAEKILGSDERIPKDWKVQGTTGYDFLNIVNTALIDPDGYHELERVYAKFTGIEKQRMETFRDRKRQVMKELFGAEVMALSNRLFDLALSHRRARDLTRREIQDALVTVTARLPVYRTYIRDFFICESDRNYIEGALRAEEGSTGGGGLEFLREVLLLEPPYYLADRRQDYLDFVMHWQQFTGSVMAKGLEDTTFYVQNPLISLNEVGGDCAGPDALLGVENFHNHNVRRLEQHPFTMNASATHDTKRGEDVRARIDVLSEMPAEWERWLSAWSQLNPSESAPDANEQVLLYQTLLGVWPISRSRLHMYLIKALREAKTQTNWLRPDEQHEKQVLEFVDRIFDSDQSRQFLRGFLKFQSRIAFFGALNSLSQILLKITSPGVPDFYQGTELWDSSLADPDNRRPVDFELRIGKLEWLKEHAKRGELLRYWRDGGIKMFMIWKALTFRRDNVDLFLRGEYIPIEVRGPHSKNIVAFARRDGRRWAVVAVPRLCSHITRTGRLPIGHMVWSDTRLSLPPHCPNEFCDIFTGKMVNSASASAIFSELPFSLLHAENQTS